MQEKVRLGLRIRIIISSFYWHQNTSSFFNRFKNSNRLILLSRKSHCSFIVLQHNQHNEADILRSPEPRSLGLFSRELWVSLMARVMRVRTPGAPGDMGHQHQRGLTRPSGARVYNRDFLHPLRVRGSGQRVKRFSYYCGSAGGLFSHKLILYTYIEKELFCECNVLRVLFLFYQHTNIK